LRMVEELGMPIMHVGACTNSKICSHDYFWELLPIQEYFTDCLEGKYSESCNNNTLYPVDFWLYRTTMTVTSEDFALAFPDKAIIAKQYHHWPIGGRLITPYHAAEILDTLGPSLLEADRLHPTTNCTPVDVSSIGHRTSGLEGGAYACYDAQYHNSKYLSNCPTRFLSMLSSTLPSVAQSKSTSSATPSKSIPPNRVLQDQDDPSFEDCKMSVLKHLGCSKPNEYNNPTITNDVSLANEHNNAMITNEVSLAANEYNNTKANEGEHNIFSSIGDKKSHTYSINKTQVYDNDEYHTLTFDAETYTTNATNIPKEYDFFAQCINDHKAYDEIYTHDNDWKGNGAQRTQNPASMPNVQPTKSTSIRPTNYPLRETYYPL